MRMILGLVRATAGTATIDGVRYAELPRPAATVGAVLDGADAHPVVTARDHLRIYATMAGLSHGRVERVIGELGMADFADRPTGGYSTGMRRRLSLATALLGDPAMARQTGHASGQLPPTPVGALVLGGYALVAAAFAVAFPLRRDVT